MPDSPRLLGRRRTPRRSGEGFTLVELVIAVGLLGGAFLSLLYLRASAVDRARQFNEERIVQRLAQEKLDEVVFGIEEGLDGAFEEKPNWAWEAEVFPISVDDVPAPLLECTITVIYPGETEDDQEEYVLTTRFFADEDHPLHQYANVGEDEP